MAHERKTRDTWQLWVNYGEGWEHECTEDTWRAIGERATEYRENCPQWARMIRLKREKIEGGN